MTHAGSRSETPAHGLMVFSMGAPGLFLAFNPLEASPGPPIMKIVILLVAAAGLWALCSMVLFRGLLHREKPPKECLGTSMGVFFIATGLVTALLFYPELQLLYTLLAAGLLIAVGVAFLLFVR